MLSAKYSSNSKAKCRNYIILTQRVIAYFCDTLQLDVSARVCIYAVQRSHTGGIAERLSSCCFGEKTWCQIGVAGVVSAVLIANN